MELDLCSNMELFSCCAGARIVAAALITGGELSTEASITIFRPSKGFISSKKTDVKRDLYLSLESPDR